MPIPLIERAPAHAGRTAIVDRTGEHSYAALLAASAAVAGTLLGERGDLAEARVAFLTSPTFAYPALQWGIWRAGGVAVPLCTVHPRPELEHVIEDADAGILVADADHIERLRPIAESSGRRLLAAEELLAHGGAATPELPDVDAQRRALIVYTSGTTGRPKGAVTTHANIAAQIAALVEAWAWRADDRVLLVLPLHHVHGIINILGCALFSGAVCEMAPKFDAAAVWERFARGGLTLFMAVPTVYSRLIAEWERAEPDRRQRLSAACGRLRLMVSGSAALPVRALERWREISGHTLLERYGMTEIGMALSNPLDGERRPGQVGRPLPGVEVRRLDENGEPVADDEPGEIEVRGDSVFREYWRRPRETAAAFRDGWFRTGDVAVVEKGSYRLLGRQSVDIIKSGGFKVSALEVEEVLRTHPAIAECAVVGVADDEWGERVAAAVELEEGGRLELDSLREWCKERLAVYKAPSRLALVEALPRNAMGKVTKPEVAKLFTRPAAS